MLTLYANTVNNNSSPESVLKNLNVTSVEKEAMLFFVKYLDAYNRRDEADLKRLDNRLANCDKAVYDNFVSNLEKNSNYTLNYFEVAGSTDNSISGIFGYSYQASLDNHSEKTINHAVTNYSLSKTGSNYILADASPYKPQNGDVTSLAIQLKSKSQQRFGTDNLSMLLGINTQDSKLKSDPQINNSITTQNSAKKPDYKNYNSKSGEFDIEYPASWEVIDNGKNVAFVEESKNASDPYRESIFINKANLNGKTLEEFVNATSETLKAKDKTFNIISSTESSFKNIKAWRLIYTFESQGAKLKALIVIIPKENSLFIYNCYASESLYSSYENIFNYVLENLKIN